MWLTSICLCKVPDLRCPVALPPFGLLSNHVKVSSVLLCDCVSRRKYVFLHHVESQVARRDLNKFKWVDRILAAIRLKHGWSECGKRGLQSHPTQKIEIFNKNSKLIFCHNVFESLLVGQLNVAKIMKSFS